MDSQQAIDLIKDYQRVVINKEKSTFEFRLSRHEHKAVTNLLTALTGVYPTDQDIAEVINW